MIREMKTFHIRSDLKNKTNKQHCVRTKHAKIKKIRSLTGTCYW